MGTSKAGASVLLLLAVGPLLLLAPWWPLPPVIVAPLAALAAVYAALIAAVGYKWWARHLQELTVPASPSQPSAQWQAGRWDVDPRHAYLANVGDATAYDVTVTVSGNVSCTAEAVPPFSAERLSSSGQACYVNLSVRQGLGASEVMTTQSRERGNAATETTEVDVHVRWRTASGEWCSQNAIID